MRKHILGKAMRKRSLAAILLSVSLIVGPVGYALAEEADSSLAAETVVSKETGIQSVLEETEAQTAGSAESEAKTAESETEESTQEETEVPETESAENELETAGEAEESVPEETQDTTERETEADAAEEIETSEAAEPALELSASSIPFSQLEVFSLRVARKTASSVTLTWCPIEGASGYNVYRYDSKNGSWIYVKSVGIGNSTTITGLKSGVYAYNVRAYIKENGKILYSKFGRTVRPALLEKPVIKSVSAVNSEQIRLEWSRVEGATGYYLYRYNSSTKKFEYVRYLYGTAVYDTVETPGTKYYYQVRAYYNGDTRGMQYSEYSASRAGAALAGGAGLKAESLASNGIKLSWNRSLGATGYCVYRYDESAKGWKLWKNTTLLTRSDTDAAAGKVYQYRIRPYYKLGDEYCFGTYSSVVRRMYIPEVANLTVSAAGNESVKLTWEKSEAARGYNIYRYDEASGTFQYVTGTLETTYTDKNLTAGKTYKYRVRAYAKAENAFYYSVYTEPQSVTVE